MVDRAAGSAVKATLRFGGLGCSISLRRGYPYEGHRCGRIIMAGTEEIVRCVSTLAEDGDCLVSPLMRLACPGNKVMILNDEDPALPCWSFGKCRECVEELHMTFGSLIHALFRRLSLLRC
jgi:hypothetical protein